MTDLTVTDVRLFDGERIHDHVDVHVRDGRVADVGEPGRRPPETPTVAGRGRTLLPGLIDCHVHLVPGSLGLVASYGVSTVLDMFSRPEDLAADLGRHRPGHADLRTSSVGATAPGGHPTLAYGPFPTVAGPEAAESFVAARVAEGARHLKVLHEDGFGLPALDAATISALCVAAHARGMVVAAHVTTAAGAVLVAECGADVLAHAPLDAMSPDQVAAVAARARGVVATLSVLDGWPGPQGPLPLSTDPLLAPRLTPAWREKLRAQADRWLPPTPAPGVAAANVLALHRAGVGVLAGTDSPNPGLVPGLSLHRELRALVAAGLSATEALVAATAGAADAFGLTDRGRVRPGARADLLLVDGDPTRDVADTGRIVAAWVAGVRAPATTEVAGSPEEAAGMAWHDAMTRRILDGLAAWTPPPRDVVRDDGEVLGRLVSTPGGWRPETGFGAALGPVADEETAEAVVRERGLASLAEPWLLTGAEGTEQEVVLMELTPSWVRVRARWPEPDDHPAGVWHDLAAVRLTAGRR